MQIKENLFIDNINNGVINYDVKEDYAKTILEKILKSVSFFIAASRP